MKNRVQRRYYVVAGEGLLPGGHFIEHHSEREEVGSGVELFAARLFR